MEIVQSWAMLKQAKQPKPSIIDIAASDRVFYPVMSLLMGGAVCSVWFAVIVVGA